MARIGLVEIDKSRLVSWIFETILVWFFENFWIQWITLKAVNEKFSFKISHWNILFRILRLWQQSKILWTASFELGVKNQDFGITMSMLCFIKNNEHRNCIWNEDVIAVEGVSWSKDGIVKFLGLELWSFGNSNEVARNGNCSEP